MVSNFEFLKECYSNLYKTMVLAESRVITEPKSSASYSRMALEEAVDLIYREEQYDLPYDDTLNNLMREQDFKLNIPESIYTGVFQFTRKIGNKGVHHGNILKPEDALLSIRYLFDFLKWFANLYADRQPDLPDAFDRSQIPKVGGAIRRLKEIEKENAKLKKELEKRIVKDRIAEDKAKEKALATEAKFEAYKTEKEALLEKLKAQKTSRRVKHSSEYTEAETRKHLIDEALKEAGWDDLHEEKEKEYPVVGMPITTDNPRGNGFADYVLWDDNGLPLAVIEAKRTSVDSVNGKHQAKLYADCLEQMHGQRPIIFYTNGYNTYIWDDCFYNYHRRVYGFYTQDELQWEIQKRKTLTDIRKPKIDPSITERDYQIMAIQRFAETLVNNDAQGNLKGERRSALLVMATGSGKTRTAASIVDILFKSNWIKRVLFLADRNALVSQAKKAFGEHLPELSAIDLTKDKENSSTRLVFSTYQTIINKIDGVRDDDERFYGIGHFDLIIVDEAHRSVYNKYGIIFEYFDAIKLGLTATPKGEIDHNTYELFDCVEGDPTYSYELKEAVREEYLVDYEILPFTTKILDEGITYQDLSPEDKIKYEKALKNDATGLFPEHIRNSAINRWLFNKKTINLVLDELMSKGLKIEAGDKLGRTIIFAVNQKHADLIADCFNKRYPYLPSGFISVVHNKVSHVQSTIELFCDKYKEQLPQVAVSVDMMDTGIDAPRVLNLVFFKKVRSYSKFWQMVGRGTRLCPDVYGINQAKKKFLIIDTARNFEFFKGFKPSLTSKAIKPLSQQIFNTRLSIARLLMVSSEPHNQVLASEALDTLHASIAGLDKDRFDVNMKLEYVDKYKQREQWNTIGDSEAIEIEYHLSGLPPPEGSREIVRRFDLMVLKQEHLKLLLKPDAKSNDKLMAIATALSSKYSVPQVERSRVLLESMKDPDFYKNLSLKKIEEIRKELRELVIYLDPNSTTSIFLDIDDEVIPEVVPMAEEVEGISDAVFKSRVEKYVRENKHNSIVGKLNSNVPITSAELNKLEEILFDDGERGSIEQYQKTYGEKPLGVFIRSIVGLDLQAANKAFGEFLVAGNLSGDQMTFIKKIIEYLEVKGVIDEDMLSDGPFKNIHDQGIYGVFNNTEREKVISIINKINQNAEVG